MEVDKYLKRPELKVDKKVIAEKVDRVMLDAIKRKIKTGERLLPEEEIFQNKYIYGSKSNFDNISVYDFFVSSGPILDESGRPNFAGIFVDFNPQDISALDNSDKALSHNNINFDFCTSEKASDLFLKLGGKITEDGKLVKGTGSSIIFSLDDIKSLLSKQLFFKSLDGDSQQEIKVNQGILTSQDSESNIFFVLDKENCIKVLVCTYIESKKIWYLIMDDLEYETEHGDRILLKS